MPDHQQPPTSHLYSIHQTPLQLVRLVSVPDNNLYLPIPPDDHTLPLSHLSFSAIAIELCDMFRLLHALQHHSKQKNSRIKEHINTFYQWFEGFFAVLTALFDTEEDVLFSWLEKSAAISIQSSLTPERRQKKKQRAKEICWDIFQLNVTFSNANPIHLISELYEEAHHLAARVLPYFQNILLEIPALLQQNLSLEERHILYHTILSNFRASEQGKFVLCAFSRAILHSNEKTNFLLEKCMCGPAPSTSLKQIKKKYKKKHTDLCHSLALETVNLLYTPTTQ